LTRRRAATSGVTRRSSHPALPGFTFALAEMFDALKLRRPS
jgi:hypothetical protein